MMSTTSTTVYESIYLSGQSVADSGFTPLVGRNDRPAWRELQFLLQVVEEGRHLKAPIVGLLSPKFGRKTGLASKDVYAFIDSNPGAEVYTFNPGPQSPYFTYNVWMHGEYFHTGITTVAQDLVDGAGVDLSLTEAGRHGPDVWCMCNYWVATSEFWTTYVGDVLRPIADFMINNSAHPAARAAMTETTHSTPLPFLPFIVERLFTTFIAARGEWRSSVRACPTLVPPNNDFEADIVRALRGRVDAADRDGYFPPDLIALMHLLCRLRRRHMLNWYATHPHPSTGRPYDPAMIKRALADLELLPTEPFRLVD